jgi:hypothetical protein
MAVVSTLANYDPATITAVISLIILAAAANIIKLFTTVIYVFL